MTFTPNIPASGQSLGNSRPEVLGNFTAIDTTIAVNHVAMNSSDAGKHKFIQIPSSNIPAATGATEWALYTNTIAGLLEIFLAPPNAGAAYQLTGNAPGFPANALNGTSWLPGGIYVQWGSRTVDSGGDQIQDNSAFLFPTPFPNNVFVALLGAEKSSTGAEGLWVKQGTLALTGFSIKTSANAGQLSPLFYIAIGN